MQENLPLGFTYVVIAGLFAGSFALPMKFTTGWKWQHNWMVFVTWAMLIMPIVIGLITVPQLFDVYKSVDFQTILKVFLFGMAWGVGVICFGIGLDYLGISLGLSIMLGLMISMGSLLPIIIYQNEELNSPKSHDIMIASLIILVGIIIISISGFLRDKNYKLKDNQQNHLDRSRFYKGLIIAILAGVLSTMQNIGFVSGNPIQVKAIQSGTNLIYAGNAVWPVVMVGCFAINFLYCAFLINKYKEWRLFGTKKIWYWPAIASSGIVWFLCMMFFGMAASKLGKLGPSIGWASFQTLAIVTGNFVGLFSGEWKNAGKMSLILNFLGIIILIIGIVVIAF